MRVSACRSCMAPIVWCVTTNGKKMPADATASPNGSFLLVEVADEPDPVAKFVNPRDRSSDLELHDSHFSTCVNAASHRKKGKV